MGPTSPHRGSEWKGEAGGSEVEKRCVHPRRCWSDGGPLGQEAGPGEETDCSLVPPEGEKPCDPLETPDPQKPKEMSLCCLQQLGLWSFSRQP